VFIPSLRSEITFVLQWTEWNPLNCIASIQAGVMLLSGLCN